MAVTARVFNEPEFVQVARILVADDDPLPRVLLEHKLGVEGHTVVTAEDGGCAEMIARTQPLDLIVLDAMMPVMDGFEVLRKLKADPQFVGVPVIMLTALKRQADVVGALREGAADYLVKPFIPDELVERVRRLLSEGGQAHAPARRSG